MKRRRRKIQKHYTITVTSDYAADKTKSYRSRFNIFRVTTVTTVLTVLMAVALTAYEFYALDKVETNLSMLKSAVSEQETVIKELGREKAELTSENEVLNGMVARTIAEKEREAAEYAKKHLPTGFPVTGATIMVDISVMDEPGEELPGYFNYDVGDKYDTGAKKAVEENPIIVFEMSAASDAVATADGKVIAINDDEVFNKSVLVDHGNGYVSIYRNQSEPKVMVGDEVVKGAIIFVGGIDNVYLGYQMKYRNAYIDPMQIMAIDN